ncbi:methyl-accepting chemotaxis protein [Paraburkholderia agricolaris]|uniref:methyl-accepting chemotaxis protein n=1 Tax=Paraburkholderia agricolaris TaxID=2152888 RepID=UPI0038B6BD6E
MTIAKRILLVIVFALVSLVFVGIFGLWNLSRVQRRLDYVQVNTMPSIQLLIDMRSDLANLRRLNLEYVLVTDAVAVHQVEDGIAAGNRRIDSRMNDYERNSRSDELDHSMLVKDREAVARFFKARDRFVAAVRTGDRSGGLAMLADGGTLGDASTKAKDQIDVHIAYQRKLSERLQQKSDLEYGHALWVMTAGMVLCVALVGALGMRLYLLVSSGLKRVQTTFEYVSDTLDLRRGVDVVRHDEIGRAAAAFNVLLKRVAKVIGEVRQSADSVSIAARQIAAGNIDLSARTEEQAASLEQTAASMEELTGTVQQNAEGAGLARKLAISATDTANRGSEVVAQMVSTMREIGVNSVKIAEITALIEGIAFQTNILALNAAVEAARAGDQGRGFAVVAAEVRTLAQRSSTAAREIRQLIEVSASTVKEGARQAEEVGRTTDTTHSAVRRVADIIGEIYTASMEQAYGIEQVGQAVSQMDEVTQQNASLVEEAAAATQSLEQQAAALNRAAASFTTGYEAL